MGKYLLIRSKEVETVDKYEYNLRNEEINDLMEKRDFVKAVEIADTIDWTRVRSVKTLCKISDLYKVNRRYEDAKVILERAYEKLPTNKSIVYSLCEICIKMGDVVGATEYYKRYVQMAPTSNQKFILLYKIYEAQDVSLEERIQVLEELKKREPLPKWCYELALLYHRIGLTTKCVEECDELILWFREGKYVKKAMELKMLHQQLTGSQEALYKNILAPDENVSSFSDEEVEKYKESVTEEMMTEEEVKDTEISEEAGEQGAPAEPEEIKEPEQEPLQELVKTVDVGQYSTINIQRALEESIKGTLAAEESNGDDKGDTLQAEEEVYEDETKIMPVKELNRAEANKAEDNSEEDDDNEEEEEAKKPGGITETILAPMMQDTGEMEEIVFPDEPVTEDTIIYDPKEKERIKASATAALESIDTQKVSKEELMKLIDEKVAYAIENAINGQQKAREDLKNATISDKSRSSGNQDNPPRSMQKMLAQEYDGQISLVVPDENPVEKQITGQIDIEGYLNDWEDSKKQRDIRREEKIDRLVAQHTDNLLADFDTQTKEGLLEKLTEEAAAEAESDADTDKAMEAEFAADAEDELPEVEELTEIEETKDEAEDTEETDSTANTIPKAEEEETEESLENKAVTADEPDDKSEENEEDPEEAAIEAEHIAAAEEEAETEGENEADERTMTDEENSLFGSFVQTKKGKRELLKALDSISLASYVGNVCVTGETGEESVDLAKNVVQYAKMTDSNFSGKIGKVSGSALNEKDMDALIEKLKGGGMIIEKAGDMSDATAEKLKKALNQENLGILVVMQDSRKAINRILGNDEELKQMFGVHIEIEELSDDALVAYGKKYAEKNEFSIDEMGILALHTRIDEMQTSDHIVTVTDVRELIDEAIDHATRFSPKHFTEILFGKRYDSEDMIILKERDFIA